MRRFSSAVVSSRLAEMRSIADSLIKDEQWSSAVGPLEALRASATPASREWKRATSELALCLQSQNRSDEAGKLYESALNSEGTEDNADETTISLLNFAELRGSQERWAEAEGLARRALALGCGPKSITRGAGLANTAAYVGMQERHDEAAELYRESSQILSENLGADSEYAVEAAAGVVRSLRQAKREAEADSFLASCSVEVGKALDESQGVGPGEDAASMVDAALEKIFDEIETKKSLDPPGFVREVMASDQEAEEFMKKWTDLGLPTDPNLMKMICDGFKEGVEGGEGEPDHVSIQVKQ